MSLLSFLGYVAAIAAIEFIGTFVSVGALYLTEKGKELQS